MDLGGGFIGSLLEWKSWISASKMDLDRVGEWDIFSFRVLLRLGFSSIDIRSSKSEMLIESSIAV